jgi:transposase
MTYSKDFRKQALSMREKEQLSFAETAERFGVAKSSLVRWQSHPEPCKTRNKPPIKIDMSALEKDIEDNPDSYHYERAARFNVSEGGIRAALKRLKMSHKKSLRHPKADEDERQKFKAKIECYEQEGKAIVYLDESGFAKESLRTHGYAKIGTRCCGTHDWQAKGRTNVIGALLAGLLLTVTLFDFNINADIFHGWVVQCLLPCVPKNSVIVMDNASFHKRSDIQEEIKQAGHILEYLPAYSPDLNPIEHKWAQAKAIRRKKRCPSDELFQQLF